MPEDSGLDLPSVLSSEMLWLDTYISDPQKVILYTSLFLQSLLGATKDSCVCTYTCLYAHHINVK